MASGDYTVSHKNGHYWNCDIFKNSDCTPLSFSTRYLCYSRNKISITPKQSFAASSTSFSISIATVNISNSLEKSTKPEDLTVKMLTEKGKIYKTCSKWFLSYGHRPEAGFSTHRWPVNVCMPKVWPYLNQVLFLFEDSPKFCNRPDLGWGNYLARRREKWNQVSPGANTRRWHVHDGQTRCNSTDVGLHQGLHECTGCHGNSCSWYSAV